jgi:hypothetical protein
MPYNKLIVGCADYQVLLLRSGISLQHSTCAQLMDDLCKVIINNLY